MIPPLPRYRLGRRFALVFSTLGMLACGKTKSLSRLPDSTGQDAGGGADTAGMGDGPGCAASPATRPASTPIWNSIAQLKNAATFYMSDAGAYVADNILYYQNGNGGWPKNIDMSLRYGIDANASPRDEKSMIDNNATTTQIRYLAYMLGAFPTCQRYTDAFNAGMGFLFNAQYQTNGGWPQVWPIEPNDYSRHITYNDNAMLHVMQIMRDIVYGNGLFSFVPADMVAKATTALNKGVDCMLKTQIIADGKKTGWCQQHDEVTLLPTNARAYELPSESGKEGPQVLGFLLSLDLSRPDMPKQDIIDAVEGAVVFYDAVKILGTRYVQANNEAGVADSWIEPDPTATPLWARFYDLDPPFRPFFCGRDGVKKYSLAEIEVERRGGYAWYGKDALAFLTTTYPAWVQKWSIGRNVLPTATDGGSADDGSNAADAGTVGDDAATAD
jgi:pectinesterase